MKLRILYSFILYLVVQSGLYGQGYYSVRRLPLSTSAYNEMSPLIHENGIIFSSNKKNDVILVTTDQEGNYMYNLYFSERKGPKNWSGTNLFSKELSTRYNESSACLSSDGTTIYYTSSLNARGNMGDNLGGDTLRNGILISNWNGNTWLTPKEFRFNSDNYNVAYPYVNSDESRLYFAADNPDGYGGFDIYYSDYTNNRWTEPVNMGPDINTSENEVFPFILDDSRLYFASRGLPGVGGLDIFYTDFINNIWQKPVNMPRPFNSRSDDFALVANPAMDTGYFVSNRRGSDDIFQFVSTFPSFTECPAQVEEDFCYEFYETGSLDLDSSDMKYEWDLGDGTKIRGLRAEHCYDSAGYYLVQLNVIDSLTGDVYFSEASYDLIIEEYEQPYILAPDTAFVNERLGFDASESNIIQFGIENYYWDFGNGEVGNGMEVEYTYTTTGTYYIKLGLTGASEEDTDVQMKACANRQIIVKER